MAHCTALAPPKRVLVVGGSGRVGASTVRWIHKLAKAEQLPVELAVGGRRQASFDAAAKRLGAKGVDDIKFVRLDLDDAASLERAVAGRSLVVHTAGPFQQRTDPTLLKACIDAGVPYCDVCDELELSRAAKKLTSDVPAVISCGIWPGASALLAARAAERLGKPLEDLEFSFFTSGTGGAGPTIVSATFLLLCTPAAVYADGELVMKEPWTEKRTAAFGPGVGARDCPLGHACPREALDGRSGADWAKGPSNVHHLIKTNLLLEIKKLIKEEGIKPAKIGLHLKAKKNPIIHNLEIKKELLNIRNIIKKTSF